MKSFKITEVTKDDMYVIFIYEDEDLVGMNYHHGIGDLDSDYLINDPRLFGLFCDVFNGSKSEMLPMALNVIHRIKEMDEVVYGICQDADKMIEHIIDRQHDLLDNYGLEMTPEELQMLKESKDKFKEQLRAIWKTNK